MFDLDANLEANNVAGLGPSAPRPNNHRSRFPPRQARSEAYAGEIDDSIEDSHLYHDLKRHPSLKRGMLRYAPLSPPFVGLGYMKMCADKQLLP